MGKKDIDVYIENQTLKKIFTKMGLDLEPVFEFSPYDLDLENRRMRHLLSFIKKYYDCGSRDLMEQIVGRFVFPPIFPGIDPDSDWFRFEKWLNGEPVRKKLKDILKKKFTYKSKSALTGQELKKEVRNLIAALDEIGFGFGLNQDIPDRIVYEYIWETLEEEQDLDDGGGWFIDGCSGYCPGCFQRPWCDTGQKGSWKEDEAAEKMHLIDDLKEFVSASPFSLDILKQYNDEDEMSHSGPTENRDGDYLPPILGRELPDKDVPINWN
jgi:hypothetical protein